MEYVSHTIEPVATEPADWAGGFDTVIVTSQTAVERIARDAAHTEAFRSVLESASLIAVGEATAELLRLHGYAPDDVAAGSARSVLEGLSESAAGRRVLWPSGAEASLDLVSLLGERGARVRRVVLWVAIASAVLPLFYPSSGGFVTLIVLQLLQAEPTNGYDLTLRIQAVTNDVLNVNAGSLYPALYRLEQRGLLRATWAESDSRRRARRRTGTCSSLSCFSSRTRRDVASALPAMCATSPSAGSSSA